MNIIEHHDDEGGFFALYPADETEMQDAETRLQEQGFVPCTAGQMPQGRNYDADRSEPDMPTITLRKLNPADSVLIKTTFG